MTEKIYVVFQEWQDKCGNRDSQILGVTNNKEEAIKILQDERTEILANCPYTADELANHDEYDLIDEPEHFDFFDAFGGWDEIIVIEEDVKPRDYIVVNYFYCGMDINEPNRKRIYFDEMIKQEDREYGCFYKYEKNGMKYKLCTSDTADGSIDTENIWGFVYKNDKPLDSVRVWCTFNSKVDD